MSFSMMTAMGDYMAEKPREIVKIDLADILDDENNDFEVEGGNDIEIKNALLKDSIEQFGLLDPLTVRPAGGGKYKLISGHRRKLAHERLVAEGKMEFQQVDCIIRESDEVDAEQMLIEANIPNRVVSDWEKMQAVKRMNVIFEKRQQEGQKIPGRRREHIAAVLCMSVSAVGRLEKIEKNLTQEYKDELKAGNIGVSVADKLASKPKEEQADIHAIKGAKVKLVDLKDEQKELAEEAREPEYREWTVKLEGVPEENAATMLELKEEQQTTSSGQADSRTGEAGESQDAAWRGTLLLVRSLEEAWCRLAGMKGGEDEAACHYAMNRLNKIIREVQAEDREG